MSRPRLLVTVPAFVPGYKSGGPIRALLNLVEAASEEFDFRILTRDRDLPTDAPYESPAPGRWHERPWGAVAYLSPRELSPMRLRHWIHAARPDAYYVNSLFFPALSIGTMGLLSLGLIPRRPVVLAPRGECAPGALGLKSQKKRMFLALARTLEAYQTALYHATAPHEAAHIRATMGNAVRIFEAADLARPPSVSPAFAREKKPGEARLITVARVSRVKNHAQVFDVLALARGRIHWDIVGDADEPRLHAELIARARSLPSHVTVTFHGAVPYEAIGTMLASAHAFILPTLGENFGHAIAEAMLAGVVPILSNRTLWRDLETSGAGWDLPLDDDAGFRRAVEWVVDASAADLAGKGREAYRYARRVCESDAPRDAFVMNVRQALERAG